MRSGLVFALLLAVLCVGIPSVRGADDLRILCYHDVRDDVRGYLDPDQYAVATETLIAHLDWLTAEGYRFVRLDDVLAARAGSKALPPKSVFLTFDDGYVSFYSRIFPILKLYDAPALIALVTDWLEAPPDAKIDYGGGPETPRSSFITWDQAREMQASGLVEFASHSDRLHRSEHSNPQDTLAPSIVTRRFLPETRSYETVEAWNERIVHDLRTSVEILEERLGKKPRAMVWPYGETNELAAHAARQAGLLIDFSLGEPDGRLPRSGTVPRDLIAANEPIAEFASRLREPLAQPAHRFLEIRVQDWFLENHTQYEKRLDSLIECAKVAGPNQILLDVFAREPQSGKIIGAYFPESGFPLISDVANRLVKLLNAKIPASVVVMLPPAPCDLIPLTGAICQYLPLQGLAIPVSWPSATAEEAMREARRWRPEAKRYDWAVGSAPVPSGQHLRFVRAADVEEKHAATVIPMADLDLDTGAAPAARQLLKWLRAGGRHTAAGPLTPEMSLDAVKTIRPVISANSNPYRQNLIRKLQPRG